MNILDRIISDKCHELVIQKQKLSSYDLYKKTVEYINAGVHTPISLKNSLLNSTSGIIAEFKRRSPSKGWIKESGRADDIPYSYSINGASGISILTNTKYFGGSPEYVQIARNKVLSTPILRKEFIIDEYQLFESRIIGSDAVLLIASALDRSECFHLASTAHELGLETLLEIHNESELDYLNDNIDMVGVNNRDLTTFVTDVAQSFHLATKLPKEQVLVSESGISQVQTVKELRQAGFRGFLIGETFMISSDPGKTLKTFINEIEAKDKNQGMRHA